MCPPDFNGYGNTADINNILNLKDRFDSHVFYVPGGSGIVRVCFKIDENGNPKADLVDYGHIEKVRKNFESLI